MEQQLTHSQSIARGAARLGERWGTAAVAELQAAPGERSERLWKLAPEGATAKRLSPLMVAGDRTESSG